MTIPPHLRDFSSELQYKASRSGGPGGQHVNKTNTKVLLLFDIDASAILDAEEKTIVKQKLATKVNQEGVLQLTSEGSRSRLANKEAATKKFHKLLQSAFEKKKPRKPTKPSKAAVAKRLDAKRQHSLKKATRQKGVE